MKFTLLFLMISFSVHAVEVAVIDETKTGDLMISFTDESLFTALDKTWLTYNCKTRFVFSGARKETFTSRSCRAETIKFILNTGYKPLDHSGRIFSR